MLEEDDASKYYGMGSKELFYETYHTLDARRKKLVNIDDEILQEKETNHGVEPELVSPMKKYQDKKLVKLASMGSPNDLRSGIARYNSPPKKFSAPAGRNGSMLPRITPLKCMHSPSTGTLGNINRAENNSLPLEVVTSVSSSDLNMEPLDMGLNERDTDGCTSPTFSVRSPRALFLAGCLKLGLPPRSLALLQQGEAGTLNLESFGLGNAMGALLAPCLQYLSSLRSINLADNNLTDLCLCQILEAIQINTSITMLNLSNNTVNRKAAKLLAEYLGTPICPLKKLVLSHADLDDDECSTFVSALQKNTQLEELDVSRNILGKAENLNFIKPELLTGGESLALLLRPDSGSLCPLKILKVQWNMIRMIGAMDLCTAVEFSPYLLHMDISYNSIGVAAGVIIGNSLFDNKTLRTLNIGHNNLPEHACFSICVGAKESNLKTVILDGNTLGELGGRVVTTIPIECGSRLICSVKGSELGNGQHAREANSTQVAINNKKPEKQSMKSSLSDSAPASDSATIAIKTVYNPIDPIGHYSIRLQAKPSSESPEAIKLAAKKAQSKGKIATPVTNTSEQENRSLMFELLTLVANNPTLVFENVWVHPTAIEFPTFVPNQSPGAGWERIQLTRFIEELDESSLCDKEMKTLRRLQKLAQLTDTPEQVTELFNKYDKDGSGELDVREFGCLLEDLGMKTTRKRVLAIMRAIDIDGSEFVELNECSTYVQQVAHRAKQRSYEMTHRARCTSVAEGTDCVRFIPPSSGLMVFDIANQYTVRLHKMIPISDCQLDYLIQAVNHSTAPGPLLCYALDTISLHLEEAEILVEKLTLHMGDVTKALASVLFHMASHREAACLVKSVLRGDKHQLRRLSTKLGNAYYPILGQFDAYYSLNLLFEMDRFCLQLLIEKSVQNAEIRQKKQVGDISQQGNWSCFRNEIYDKHVVAAPAPAPSATDTSPTGFPIPTKDKDTPPPKYKMEYSDFSPMPVHGTVSFDFVGCSQPHVQFDHPTSDKRFLNVLLASKLLPDHRKEWTIEQFDKMKSATERSVINPGYVHWKTGVGRCEAIRYYIKNTLTVHAVSSKRKDEVAESQQKHKGGGGGLIRCGVDAGDEESDSEGEDDEASKLGKNGKKNGQLPPLNAGGHGHAQVPKKPLTLQQKRKLGAIPIHQNTCEYFRNILCATWVRCRHVALLLQLYQHAASRKWRSKFGSYRVELVVTLFSRLFDLHNFELILMNLSPIEHACVLHRLGALSIFNPWKPDGAYTFNLTVYEEAQVCKMLIHLEVHEQKKINCEWRREGITKPEIRCVPEIGMKSKWLGEGMRRAAASREYEIMFMVFDSGSGIRPMLPDVPDKAKKSSGPDAKPDPRYLPWQILQLHLREVLLSLCLIPPVFIGLEAEYDEYHAHDGCARENGCGHVSAALSRSRSEVVVEAASEEAACFEEDEAVDLNAVPDEEDLEAALELEHEEDDLAETAELVPAEERSLASAQDAFDRPLTAVLVDNVQRSKKMHQFVDAVELLKFHPPSNCINWKYSGAPPPAV